jgi:micrococcal nuclease
LSRLLAPLTCLLLACGLESDTTASGPTPERPAPQREPVAESATEHAPERPGEPRQDGDASNRARGGERQPNGRKRNRVLVTRVVDGDTIEVRRGRIVDVRLIGIDTPETVHPSEPVQCFGPAASRRTSKALEGDVVRLEFDVERRDHYGRLLAYVWDDARLFNKVLVEHGFATVSTYPPNVRYVERFAAAQRRARRADRGLWGTCWRTATDDGARRSSTASMDDHGSNDGRCTSAYTGACIPPPPPDLDCADVPGGFRSMGPDPHGLDGDSDGVACE